MPDIDLSPAGRARLRELKAARDAENGLHARIGEHCPICVYTEAAVENLHATLDMIDRLEKYELLYEPVEEFLRGHPEHRSAARGRMAAVIREIDEEIRVRAAKEASDG